MENSIKIYYENLNIPTFFYNKGKLVWHNKASERLLKKEELLDKISKLELSREEVKNNFVVDGVAYEINIRPFQDAFFIEVVEERKNNVVSCIKQFYEKVKAPVFLCRGNNLLWHNEAATELFSNIKLKKQILQFKDSKIARKETFICGDYFYKVLVRPFEDFFYVEIIEKLPVGFNNKRELYKITNELSEMEILDNIARSVVHDVSQALDKISDILERNNNFTGLEFVDIILKRMYSFMRATNLCYEYEMLLQDKTDMNSEIVDIFVEIDVLCSAIKSLIRKSQISFEWDVPNEKIFCDIDMHKLGFALFHLICNAYRFSLPGSTIKVIARIDQYNNIKIDVCDTGVGMSKETLNKVLKPFFSHDIFSGDIAGVGLGLTYVGVFADKVNGKLNISSNKKGTRVSLSIPIVTLSDVMGLSSHILNYSERKYDNIVATLVGSLHESEKKVKV